MKKRFIGKVLTFKYTDRPTRITGILVDYNDDWTLLKYNAFDYLIDGYIILRNKNIEFAQRMEKELFKDKYLN